MLKTVKRNINLFIFFIYTTTFLVIYFMLFADDYKYSEVSPDGKYKLEVYTQQSLFAMPGSGGFYDRPTRVVLKNSWGKTIGKSNDNCSVLYGDIKIVWDVKNNQVFFSKTEAININTGECIK